MQNTFSPACFLLSVLFAVNSCNTKPKDQDCAKFKNGEFFIKATKITPSYSVRRTDSLQYETNNETGAVRIFSVKWVNPCEYELRLLHKTSDSATLNQSPLRDSLEKVTSTIVLLATTPKYYIFEIKKEGIRMTYMDTMYVMK